MVSGGCLEGVWRMSEGWMGVCSEWLWVSSQSFGHKYAWSNPKTRIEGMCFFLCPFSKSALRAQKGIKIQKVMLLWPAFFLTKTWWSFRQSDLFLCIGLGLGGHESNFWPCVLCPPPNLWICLTYAGVSYARCFEAKESALLLVTVSKLPERWSSFTPKNHFCALQMRHL